MLGAGTVLGLDLDPDALDTCQQNLEAFDIDNVDLVNGNVTDADLILRQKFEVVVMNPPFGTKHNKGND
jgi:predicted RNA methylase